MALPTIPSTNKRLYGVFRQSCNCSDTTNISLRGLSINSPTMNYNTTFRTILPSTSDSTNLGMLSNWLVAVNLDPSYDQTDPNQHKMSEFPVGRSVESDGYLPR